MTYRRFAALAIGASLVGPVAAHAQTLMLPSVWGGAPYVTLEGGWNHIDPNLYAKGNYDTLGAELKTGEGYLVGGAIGMAWGPTRLELGFDYAYNGMRKVRVANSGAFAGGLASGDANGDIYALEPMIRAYYDLPWNFWGVVPYVGLGVGAVIINLDDIVDAGKTVANDSDPVGAVQGIVGARYDLNTNWAASVEYRFTNGFSPNFVDGTGHSFSSSDYRTSSVLLKVSYSFGAPPPPPPPPAPAAAPVPPAPVAQPTPGPRQLFLVFFDFDKYSLTQAGQQVLDQAAAAYKQDQSVRIEVTGYTDTVGTQAYNLRLSQRRAEAARDYLERQGVPAERMDVAWKGKEDLRVPTPDGVREPQNRRVEIIIP